MPKVKTNSGAKKRFSFTGTGKVKRRHAYHSHILTKKTKKQKRNLVGTTIVDDSNMKQVRDLLCLRVNHVASRAKRKRILKLTRGYFGARKNVWTVAKNTWEKGLTYAYRDRRNKKRNFRSLWIQRINAAARMEGMSYSVLMGKLAKAGIEINRKVLADLAMNNPEAFKAIVEKVK